ncbi:hypothetical protein LZ30DRAFT_79213 [Colletotrichum cereale]|nr:hypothetical protein LZ30DRAFT_79213 [Colletotrichum cereale]
MSPLATLHRYAFEGRVNMPLSFLRKVKTLRSFEMLVLNFPRWNSTGRLTNPRFTSVCFKALGIGKTNQALAGKLEGTGPTGATGRAVLHAASGQDYRGFGFNNMTALASSGYALYMARRCAVIERNARARNPNLIWFGILGPEYQPALRVVESWSVDRRYYLRPVSVAGR